jgi:hypothetical protein
MEDLKKAGPETVRIVKLMGQCTSRPLLGNCFRLTLILEKGECSEIWKGGKKDDKIKRKKERNRE